MGLKYSHNNNFEYNHAEDQRYFDAHQGNLIHKWTHYFDIYDRHFQSFQGKEVHLLEIGVSQGALSSYGKNSLAQFALLWH